tara:strand:+ start:201567 stop:201965 length:399 start_codon:yes stop_codon:yes gene_type:complete
MQNIIQNLETIIMTCSAFKKSHPAKRHTYIADTLQQLEKFLSDHIGILETSDKGDAYTQEAIDALNNCLNGHINNTPNWQNDIAFKRMTAIAHNKMLDTLSELRDYAEIQEAARARQVNEMNRLRRMTLHSV